MKKIVHYSFIAFVAIGLTFSSCKKKDQENEADDSLEQSQMASDESQQDAESEAAFGEANDAMLTTGMGKTDVIVNADIDSSSIAQKKLIINYHGLNRDGSRSRSGQVVVELTTGNRWVDAGAVITVTFNNFKVTRTSDQKSLTFNGSAAITNVSGGHIWDNATIVHRAIGQLTMTFDDGTQRIWNIARKRTFTNIGGVRKMSTEGEGNAGGFDKLIAWGSNRQNNPFYTQISQAVVFSDACPGKPVSGIKIHRGIKREITVTFGTDANGNPETNTSDCPYGAKISWTNGLGKAMMVVIKY